MNLNEMSETNLEEELLSALTEAGIEFSSCRVPYTYHHDFVREFYADFSRSDIAQRIANLPVVEKCAKLILGCLGYLINNASDIRPFSTVRIKSLLQQAIDERDNNSKHYDTEYWCAHFQSVIWG